MNKHYADRDIIAQGDFYIAHVNAMTREKLHSKSDIAAELAHRDIENSRLSAALISARTEISTARRLAEAGVSGTFGFDNDETGNYAQGQIDLGRRLLEALSVEDSGNG